MRQLVSRLSSNSSLLTLYLGRVDIFYIKAMVLIGKLSFTFASWSVSRECWIELVVSKFLVTFLVFCFPSVL